MIFGMMVQLSPLNLLVTKNFKISKFKMADGNHLENRKMQYLRKHLADFDEILHDGTY